jgi:uncharacterized protein DUF3105
MSTPSSPDSPGRPPTQTPSSPLGARLGLLLVGAGVVLLLVLGLALVVNTRRSQAGPTPAGVQTFTGLSRAHTTAPVTYPQTPPVGGAHAPAWQTCGFYSTPVASENAVHSLEHGAVWITYRPDLPAEQVSALRALAQGQAYVLVSPYPGLPAPMVASAWGKQLRVTTASDPALADFVQVYQAGPQTPEPGAPCTGGVGRPE